MPYMKWEKEYSVGILKIDEQHMKLFEYINDLHDAMKLGKSKEILSGLIDKLVNYTQAHFTLEESYLTKHQYPEFIQHQKEHKSFIDKVNTFKTNYALTSGLLSIDIMQFLKDWLIKHVMGTDKKYAGFLNEKGLR